MGTPGNPEGLPHFSLKALMAQKLGVALRTNEAREYGTLLPSEFRKVDVPERMPEKFKLSLKRVMDRIDSRPRYSFLAFDEPPHDSCVGGPMLVDILRDCRGGYVLQECPFAGYIPDIALYPSADAAGPSCVIEVVDTSPPSTRKLRELERRGVAVYQLDAKKASPLSVLEDPVPVQPLVLPPCGKALRKEIEQIDLFWESAQEPFVGIKFYPSGTQAYLYGEQKVGSLSWSHGEPEIRGLSKLQVDWSSVPFVSPVGTPHTVRRETFMAYMMWLKANVLIKVHKREATLDDKPDRHVRLTQLESALIRHIDDLMHMVRIP